MEVIELDTNFGSTFSGVLTDDRGRVQAIWGSFSTQYLQLAKYFRPDNFYGGKGTGLINGIKRPMLLVRILVVELYPINRFQRPGSLD
ncbi:hypothetical protein IFM89_025234 [Coptis chinensis]|uniref:Uncharacterized protein n=1 Tax=Coptis chinensis TaxID=261450 RepID=A0A835GXS3_9MAGN|nr:hypothetical protein IFM89_025234 [Coptis chinensis]